MLRNHHEQREHDGHKKTLEELEPNPHKKVSVRPLS